MTHYTDFVKLHMAKLGKSIPAKERFKMIAKLWAASKEAQPAAQPAAKAARAIKAVKEAKGGDFMDFFPVLKAMGAGLKEVKAKAKPAKRSVKAKAVKGGSLNDIHDLSDDDDEAQPPSVAAIEKLKSNVIKRGGYQGYQGHYPDAINESVMQQLVKKH